MPNVDPDTLDRVDVVYKVTAEFLITAGTYDGVLNKRALAEHIASNGVDEHHITDVSIQEVHIDEEVVAQA